MKIDIREAVESDLPALVELNAEVQELHVGFRPEVFKSTAGHDMSPGLAQFVGNDGFTTLLARCDDTPAGYAIIKIRRRGEDAFKFAHNQILVIQVGVAEKYRRKGIGTALLNKIRSIAREEGIERLEIDVYSVNEGSKQFYISQGFAVFREVLESRT